MSRRNYKHGDHKVICDICGFVYYRSECLKNWKGQIVCKKDFENRHPQDFVKARADKQSVRDPRPDTQTMLGTTAIKVAASKDDLTIDVNSISGLADDDSIGITLDDGTLQWTTVNGTPAGDTVTLAEALPDDAAIGNVVYVPGDDFLTANEVSAADL